MTKGNDVAGVLVDRFQRIGLWFAIASPILIAAMLVAASLLRSGIVVWNWFELSPFLLTDWDGPASAFQSNVLLNAVATGWAGLGLDPTSFVWQLIQILVTMAVFALLCWLVLRRTHETSGYLALALILSSGIAAVLWREIGRYDALYVAGIAIAALAVRPAWSWLGVAIAVLSSPEQAIVAAVLLIMLALLPMFRSWLAVGMRLFIGAIVALSVIQLWFVLAGDPFKTRIGVLLHHMIGEPIEAASAYDTKQGFVQFTLEKAMVSLSAGTALVWSILGMTALVVLLFLLAQKRWWQAAYLIVVVALIPVVVSFVFGEDRTRDSALVSAAVIIALAVTGSALVAKLVAKLPGDSRIWLVWLAIVAALIPMTYFYLYAEEPWRWTKELFISINNGVPFVNDGTLR